MLVVDWLLGTHTAGGTLFAVFLLAHLGALIALRPPDLSEKGGKLAGVRRPVEAPSTVFPSHSARPVRSLTCEAMTKH